VTGIESNHKPVEKATKGMEVCVKIEPIPGEAPKMYGRHFDDTDPLVSKVSLHITLQIDQLFNIKNLNQAIHWVSNTRGKGPNNLKKNFFPIYSRYPESQLTLSRNISETTFRKLTGN
jgi:hypothetical protein